MSPRGHNSGPPASSTRSSASTPYPRRPSGQPKSSRQQFSACGACRMRRVRCDLKDLPIDQAGPNPSCSNCKERGLKCVDEFADVKAVKLLRRGRRLQQVERIYGKISDSDHAEGHSSASHARPRIIPGLQPEFFSSPFWRWFSTQRPIFDLNEFPARFFAHTKGSQILNPEGQILAMLLVVWAFSFGINERGVEEAGGFDFPLASDFDTSSSASPRNARRASVNIPLDREASQSLKGGIDQRRSERRERTDLMLREVLEFVDLHSVMRHPTWDGVRILLLILPLMEESHHLDKLMMYEAALAQSHALWSLPSSSGPSPFSHVPDDALVRLRVYCYAHLQEGIAGGLRGGRLTLDSDDLASVQHSLQSTGFVDSGSPPFTGPSDGLPLPLSPHHRSSASSPFWHPNDVFSLPLRLSSVCRKVHTVLTGAKAARCQEMGGDLDAAGMRDIWDGLSKCWDDFEAVRRMGAATITDDGIDLDRFASAWQIFIFECHNIIRETLKHRINRKASSPPLYSSNSPRPSSEHSSTSTASSSYSSAQGLHGIALQHCGRLLPCVVSIIRLHLDRGSREPEGASLFRWDTGLVKDGIFFAGVLAAGGEADLPIYTEDRVFKQEEVDGVSSGVEEESVRLCLRALSEMRWAFAKSEDRIDSIKLMWDSRRRSARLPPGPEYTTHHDMSPFRYVQDQQRHCPVPAYGYAKGMGHANPHAGLPLSTLNDRSARPPLSLTLSSRTYAESAPNTACSNDGSAPLGWPSYTPPGTGTSATTSTSTGFSGDSPVFTTRIPAPGLSAFKTDGLTADDTFYNIPSVEMESQFTYNAPMGGTAGALSDPSLGAYTHRPSSHQSQHNVGPGSAGHGYMDSVAAYMPAGATHALAHAAEEMATVAQFSTADFY